jgi:DNA polymerase
MNDFQKKIEPKANNFLSEIVEALNNQKDIFGDELLEKNILQRKTEIVADKTSIKKTVKTVNVAEIKLKGKGTDNIFAEPKENWELTNNLDDLNKLICDCKKCQLGATRNKFVFGSGNPNADVMVVGEGPGADEDAQGLPFVGRAGKLLTDILKAIKFSREEVYIANIVKCRPPGNRTPYPKEMETCLPYLLRQIELIKPKLILCLGLTAAQGLLKKKDSLTNMRGKIFDFEILGLQKIKVMVTYHPAALLRNPNWKRGCWEDVKMFRKLYDDLIQKM